MNSELKVFTPYNGDSTATKKNNSYKGIFPKWRTIYFC